MTYTDLKVWPEEVLKQICEPITEFDDSLKQVAADMNAVLQHFKGIGIAGPQVGFSKQIFLADLSALSKEEAKGCGYERPKFFVNPRLLSAEGESKQVEGCLSFPSFRQEVTRASKIIMEAEDIEGKTFTTEASGIYATVLQHEFDHLTGKTLYDWMGPVKRDLVKRKLGKFRKKLEAMRSL